MSTLSFPYSPVMLAALIGIVSFSPVFAEEPDVVDPTTGETVAISEIDIDALSDEDRANIGDQLAELGIRPGGRDQGRVDLSEVEVIDPTTGETVAFGEIDHSSLSDEDREDIGDQLADQGLSVGHGGLGSHGGRGGEGHGGPRG